MSGRGGATEETKLLDGGVDFDEEIKKFARDTKVNCDIATNQISQKLELILGFSDKDHYKNALSALCQVLPDQKAQNDNRALGFSQAFSFESDLQLKIPFNDSLAAKAFILSKLLPEVRAVTLQSDGCSCSCVML